MKSSNDKDYNEVKKARKDLMKFSYRVQSRLDLMRLIIAIIILGVIFLVFGVR